MSNNNSTTTFSPHVGDRVDMERRLINYVNPTRPRNKKGRAIVPINDQLYDVLSEFQRCAVTLYVIEWQGRPVSHIWHSIKAAGKRAGLPFDMYPYALRHTAAVWMAEDDVPLELIAQYLGHTSTHITYEYYARYSPTYMQRAASSLRIKPGRAIENNQ